MHNIESRERVERESTFNKYRRDIKHFIAHLVLKIFWQFVIAQFFSMLLAHDE